MCACLAIYENLYDTRIFHLLFLTCTFSAIKWQKIIAIIDKSVTFYVKEIIIIGLYVCLFSY